MRGGCVSCVWLCEAGEKSKDDFEGVLRNRARLVLEGKMGFCLIDVLLQTIGSTGDGFR